MRPENIWRYFLAKKAGNEIGLQDINKTGEQDVDKKDSKPTFQCGFESF